MTSIVGCIAYILVKLNHTSEIVNQVKARILIDCFAWNLSLYKRLNQCLNLGLFPFDVLAELLCFEVSGDIYGECAHVPEISLKFWSLRTTFNIVNILVDNCMYLK